MFKSVDEMDLEKLRNSIMDKYCYEISVDELREIFADCFKKRNILTDNAVAAIATPRLLRMRKTLLLHPEYGVLVNVYIDKRYGLLFVKFHEPRSVSYEIEELNNEGR